MQVGGKIEAFTEQSVMGWIAIYGTSEMKPRLELLLDATVLAVADASGYRPDVADKGFGDGRVQFKLDFPADRTLTAEEKSRLRLRFAGSDIYLELPFKPTNAVRSASFSGEQTAYPVLIVGSPRSGTSVLAQAMLRAGYHGFEEGNLLGLGEFLNQRIDWYFNEIDASNQLTLLGTTNRDALKNKILDVLVGEVENSNRKIPWFDKTGNPETILLLPYLMERWPNSRAIFSRRRGIENIMSRMVKFPNRDFDYHCKDWAANMQAWRSVSNRLDPSRIIEIDQNELLDMLATTLT
jgi:hypothetical protein